MPNLSPVPDRVEHLRAQQSISARRFDSRSPLRGSHRGRRGAEAFRHFRYGRACDCVFRRRKRGTERPAYGRGYESRLPACGKILCAHCEDEGLLNGGYIHDGAYARQHGHRGIPSEAEWRQVERDLQLAQKTGCRYHVCHVSTKESVDLIRRAKADGVDVTCETAPHYLLLSEQDLKEEGRFKMNPPLRAPADRQP